MRRRAYLTGVTVSVAGLSGCSGILGDSGDGGSDPDGPAETAAAFQTALIETDVEGANDRLHGDSPIGEVTTSHTESYQDADIELDGTEVLEENDTTATVEVSMTVSSDNGRQTTPSLVYELRTEDGEWRVYGDVTEDERGQEPPAVPSVQWETTEVTNDAGATTRVEMQVLSGDVFPVSTLSVRIDGASVAPVNVDTDVSAGTTLVVSFDGGGSGPGAGSELRLVWSPENAADTYTLTTYELTNDAAGGVEHRLVVE